MSHFGASVAIRHDGALLIGAPSSGASRGSVFFAHLSGGSWIDSIREVDTISQRAVGGDSVGHAVAIGDSALFASAPGGEGVVYAVSMCARSISGLPCAV